MDYDILQEALDQGIIDISHIQQTMELKKREELLKKHKFNIWCNESTGLWNTYLPEPEGRKRITKKTREEIDDVLVAFYKLQETSPTIEDVFNEWNNRKRDLGKIKGATHTRNVQVFNRFYSKMRKRRIGSVSPEDISDFLEEQISAFDLSAKAFSNLKSITRGFLKRAKKLHYIKWNVEEMFQEMDVSDVDFKKTIKEDYEEVYNEEETELIKEYLICHADNIRNLGLLLLFITGLRVGELCTLTKDNLDINNMTVSVRKTETKYKDADGKWHYEVSDFPKSEAGWRTIVIPTEYRWLFARLLWGKDDQYLFTGDNGKRLTTESFRKHLDRVNKNLGIYHKSPHKIRKTYGTILMDSNVDERFVLDQMGHTDIMTSEIHYHRNRKSIEKKHEILQKVPI